MQYNYCIAGNSNIGIVLQESVLQYTILYCREEGSVVLQDCIAGGLAVGRLYRNTKNCIVNRQGTWAGMYCNTTTALATRPWPGAGRAAGRAGHAQGAQGARGERRWQAGRAGPVGGRRAGRPDERQMGGSYARGTSGRARQGAIGARQGLAGRIAWARGLATGCALGALGLFSTRFDSVLFLSQFLDIVREPGS